MKASPSLPVRVIEPMPPEFTSPLPARLRATLGLLGLLLAGTACGPKIGDPCENAFECSPLARDRECDASYMYESKGECTIWGCSLGGCPDEAACVTVFPTAFLSGRCQAQSQEAACGLNELCLPDGICADARLGRSSCRLICEDDSDCRAGYRCQAAGTNGLYLSPKAGSFVWEGSGASICVPE